MKEITISENLLTEKGTFEKIYVLKANKKSNIIGVGNYLKCKK